MRTVLRRVIALTIATLALSAASALPASASVHHVAHVGVSYALI